MVAVLVSHFKLNKDLNKQASPWAPFQHRTFRFIWIATVFSNVGTWMHDVGAAWLMVTLTSDPLMVSLIQAATALPIFIFALPAGALADIVDRRRYLLTIQCFMFITATALAIVTWMGGISPWLLFAFTFVLGCGAAFSAPAWQAVVPELVPRDQLGAAVALNSTGINVSRAIGPALGGLLIVLHGPVLTFALNAVTFTGILFILYHWRREPIMSALPAERFLNAMRSGLRYTRGSSVLQIVLLRAVAFFFSASVIWALLPLVAKVQLNQSAVGFGLLVGSIGLGAVIGATQLPGLRRRFSSDHLVMAASVLMAVAAFSLAMISSISAAIIVMLFVGLAWIVALSSLNVAAQQSAPDWVRARVLSIYLVAFFGSMALGSGVWGWCAKLLSTSDALMIAAGVQLLAIFMTARFRLSKSDGIDLAPSGHWPAPVLTGSVEPDRGPVMITVDYRIDPKDAPAFLEMLSLLADARRRDGAYAWGVFEDVSESGRYLEYFIEDSWLEHLRHHERVSKEDHALQESVQVFHSGETPPNVSHFLAPAREGEVAVSAPLKKGFLK